MANKDDKQKYIDRKAELTKLADDELALYQQAGRDQATHLDAHHNAAGAAAEMDFWINS